MNQQELLADLARLKEMDKPPTVFAVWPLEKLIWLYEQTIQNEATLTYTGAVRRLDESEGKDSAMYWIEEKFDHFLKSNNLEEKQYIVKFCLLEKEKTK